MGTRTVRRFSTVSLKDHLALSAGVADRREGPSEGRLRERIAVRSFESPREDAGPAGGADGSRDKVPLKPYPLPGQPVDVRRFNNRVAGAAHGVKTLVIGEDEENIRPTAFGRAARKPGANSQSP